MPELIMIGKLVLASLYGGVIGFVREREGKAAGLRTHLLVCMGSALVMLTSMTMGGLFTGVDASRIAAGVITGIGFLGAGAIIREPGTVKGLTTAASIWVVAAIGLAIGCGYYLGATITTIITLIALVFLRILEIKYIRPEKRKED